MSNDQIREGYARPRFEDEDYPTLRLFPHYELKRNRKHLRILSNFYYLLAAFYTSIGVWLLLRVLLGVAMLGKKDSSLPPPEVERLIITIGAGVSLFSWAMVAALLLAGYSPCNRSRYTSTAW